MLILDTDIASTFAKVDQFKLLNEIFGSEEIAISESVYKELLVAKQEGYTFPQKVFSYSKVVSLERSNEFEDFEKFMGREEIHQGEAESISIALNRKWIFLTNDSLALKFAFNKGVKALDLKDILRKAAMGRVLTAKEMDELINSIEEKDKTYLANKEDITEAYEEGG